MNYRWIRLLLLFVLCACFTACSGTTPRTKATPSASEPKITEEDVTDDRSFQPGPGVQEQQPGVVGPPAPPVEEQPSVGGVDTGPRQPRRYEFRDEKGRGKNWKPGESGGEREP
jgi:hypothetical protein